MNIYLLFANRVPFDSLTYPPAYDSTIMDQIWDTSKYYNVYDLYDDPIVENSLIIVERNYLPDLVNRTSLSEQLQACKNKKIIVLYHYKCLSLPYSDSGIIHDKDILVNQLGFEPKNIMYITQLKADTKVVTSEFGPDVKVTYFDKWLEEFYRYQIKISFSKKRKHLDKNSNLQDKLYSILIRRFEETRLEVMCEFISRDLLSDFYYTFAAQGGTIPESDVNLRIDNYVNHLPLKYLPHKNKIIEWTKNIPYKAEKISLQNYQDYEELFTANLSDYYNHSKINVVLETDFYECDSNNSYFSIITEKTYKAMFYKKPFIILSQPGTLQTLRDCGYRTFGHVINESYDNIISKEQRLRAVSNELIRIRNLDQTELQNLINECQENIEHNYNLLLTEAKRKVPQEFTIANFI